ncbi:beta strand repeat-containing protein [Lacipirellula parvula]|uniref:Uncharacterized protein n=1 Tax=Lacipirellula parvula TaxID=2650471 RepID=A0A5K7XFY0_9BACT|nr:choice-of-anchor Q domain-containing protein [Lacipirellula parvula]BBO33143.1 hypothetical protein PLANPX_2755 [Lacipirellula parvula]
MSRRSRGQWFSAVSFLGQGNTKRNRTVRPETRPLRMETLEDRRVLAAVVVGVGNNVVNGDTSSIAALIASPGADGISLHEAILAANATSGANSISFAPGVAGTTISIAGGLPTLTGNLALQGPITLEGNLFTRGLAIDAGANVSITGFTMRSCYANVNGGGVYNAGNLTLTSCTFRANNAGDSGGAIYNAAGATLTATFLTAQDNFAGMFGAGIFNAGTLNVSSSHRGYDPTFLYSTGPTANGFIANVSEGYGGAIFNAGSGNATFTDVSMLFNSASANGGGIFNEGVMTVNGIVGPTELPVAPGYNFPQKFAFDVLAYNNAMEGAGAYNTGTLTMIGCSIKNNSSLPPGVGGGVTNAGSLTLIDCTVTGSTPDSIVNYNVLSVVNSTFSANSGQAISNGGTATITSSTIAGNGIGINNGGTLALNNSVLASNSSGNIVGGGGLSGSNNFVSDGSGAGLTGTLTGDAMLGPLTIANGGATATMRPLVGSPLLNVGNNSLVPGGVTTDQRGAKRIKNGTVDIGAVEVGAETIEVTTVIDEDNGTISAAQGTGTSLREAIGYASGYLPIDGATITFAANVVGAIELGVKQLPDITGNLIIVGPGANALAIDGHNVGPTPNGYGGIVSIYSEMADGDYSGVAISGLTFRNGFAAESGGAIAGSRKLTLTSCNFVGNSAGYRGGAIVGGIGIMTLVDCLFLGNSTRTGTSYVEGGGAIEYGGVLNVTHSTFSGNTTGAYGGAIRSLGTATITDSSFTGNSAFGGGAIYNYKYGLENKPGWGVALIINSTLSGNSASYGGALASEFQAGWGVYSTATVVNSTVDGNLAAVRGGAIYNAGDLTITSSTLFGNSADAGAGGIDNGTPFNTGGTNGRGTVTLNNSIIDSAAGADVAIGADFIGAFAGSYNLISDGAGGLANTITGDALLGPLKNNGGLTRTRAPLAGSAAINGGNPASIPGAAGLPLVDQRGAGYARLLGSRIDLGAVEVASGDFNYDGRVDGADFLAWQRQFGSAAAPSGSGADGNGSGSVDGADLNVWRGQFGQPSGGSAVVAATPASVMQVTVAAPAPAAISGDERDQFEDGLAEEQPAAAVFAPLAGLATSSGVTRRDAAFAALTKQADAIEASAGFVNRRLRYEERGASDSPAELESCFAALDEEEAAGATVDEFAGAMVGAW